METTAIASSPAGGIGGRHGGVTRTGATDVARRAGDVVADVHDRASRYPVDATDRAAVVRRAAETRGAEVLVGGDDVLVVVGELGLVGVTLGSLEEAPLRVDS